MSEERTFTCNLCEALCGLRVTLDGDRVEKVRGNPDDVFSRGHICPKAVGLGELLHDPDRVRFPLRRTKDGFERTSWDEAYAEIGARLRAIRQEHGKNAVALYIGNPCVHAHRSGLASQLLTAALATENRFDPNSQDSNPRLFACLQMYGDVLSMAVPDVERIQHFLLLGANPAASSGSQMALGDPKARFREIRERGGRVVLVDPRRTESAAWATEHVFIRPGGDAALVLSMLHVVFAEGFVDDVAVDDVALGRAELRAIARGYPPERVADAIGVPADVIRRLARELAAEPKSACYARVGVCQNEFGPVASWLVEALNVVLGRFDRPGGVMFPTPSADVAPLGRLLNGHGRWRSRVRGLPEMLGAIPSAVMSEEMETPGEGQIRALVCLAGNPVLTTPNGPRLARALEKLELVVAIDYYVNETSKHAHFVLPTKHVFETGNYDLILGRFPVRNVAKYSPPILETNEDTRDDWDVAQELAARVVLGRPLPPTLAGWVRRAPERLVDFLLRTGPHRLSLEALTKAEHGIDLGPLVPSGGSRVFGPGRRIQLAPEVFVRDLPRLDRWLEERPAGGLVLIGRRHLRSNNSWMHNLPALAKGPDRARLMMHPDDAIELGPSGTEVHVTSRTGKVSAILETTPDVMRGVVSLPHGFGHREAQGTLKVAGALPGESANVLTDELFVEPVLGTSILQGVPVAVTRT